jgi:cytochrome c553
MTRRAPRASVVLPVLTALLTIFLTSCSACTEQFDPSKDKARFENERETATAVESGAKLQKDGSLPSGTGPVVDINERYTTLCSTCHGAQGHGDGPGSAALEPKPRNFTDKAWAAATSDERIATVIKNGGASVGLSPAMAPWGAVLSDDEIKLMVGKVRTFSH